MPDKVYYKIELESVTPIILPAPRLEGADKLGIVPQTLKSKLNTRCKNLVSVQWQISLSLAILLRKCDRDPVDDSS